MYNDTLCALADTATLDAGSSQIGRTPRPMPSSTYGPRFGSPMVRPVKSAGAAVGDDLFEERRRLEEISKLLVVLDSSYFEDYQRSLDHESRTDFTLFMSRHSDVRIPLLGAESSGKLVATWNTAGGCLSIRFVGSSQLHYAISLKHGERPTRTWGESSITDVFSDADAKRLTTN